MPIDVRPIADPVALEGVFPSGGKPYLGSPEVVDDLVKGLMGTARDYVRNAMKRVDPEDNRRAMMGKIAETKSILLGQTDRYSPTPFNTTGEIARYLAGRYGMQDDPDPLGGILAKIALDTVKLYKSWQLDQISDAECETQLEAIRTEATRDLLGLPNDKAD
jgi:hypothetical protein